MNNENNLKIENVGKTAYFFSRAQNFNTEAGNNVTVNYGCSFYVNNEWLEDQYKHGKFTTALLMVHELIENEPEYIKLIEINDQMYKQIFDYFFTTITA
jgi:hypothetical protein